MKKVILFDFDGTLADSFENFLGIVDTMSEKYNLPHISRDELEKLRSEEPKAILKHLKIPFYKIPFLARDMKTMQKQQIDTIKPCKGIPEVLYRLQEHGHILGIATSNAKQNVETFLKNNTIDIFTYLSTDIGIFGKAHAIQNFLKQNNLSKEQLIYVGDEIRDIQACKKVGVKIISVGWGFNSKEGLSKFYPDFLIDAPEELLQIVEDSPLHQVKS